MDLSYVLGNKATYDELLVDLELIDRLDWTSVGFENVVVWQSKEGPVQSPCRISGPTYIWFDPVTRKALSEEESKYRAMCDYAPGPKAMS